MADDLTDALTAIVAVTTLPIGTLALLFVGWEIGMIVFVVGWFLLTPLIPIVGEELLPALDKSSGDAASDADADADDALAELRNRYARGEIGDAEFERQVEKLIETEDMEVDRGTNSDWNEGTPTNFDRDEGTPENFDRDEGDPEFERARD